MPIDLNILSLYRVNGQEPASQPGLMAYAPPRKAARGRERESLLISFLLNGNRPFAPEEYETLINEAAVIFHATHGALTAALRAAAEAINNAMLERNLSTTGRGQYAIGWLTLAALRDTQLTILQCGPTHVITFSKGMARHIHDPAISGKGLGLSQSINRYFSQVQLQPGDRLLICPKLPPAWENALESDRGLPAPEQTRKHMLAIADGDVNGALIQVTEGVGAIHFLVDVPPPPPTPQAVEASQTVDSPPAFSPLSPAPAHVIGRPPEEQPSAYAIPPQSTDEDLVEQLAESAMLRTFPPSIPRAEEGIEFESMPVSEEEEQVEFEAVDVTSTSSPTTEEIAQRRAESQRKMARVAVGGIQAWRRVTEQVGTRIRKFLPNLLPGGESDIALPIPARVFISILIPLLVATIGVVVYMRLGSSSQYESFLAQAQLMRGQAVQETDPIRANEAWNAVLQFALQAEQYNETDETLSLKQEAQTRLDALLGVTRLRFNPVFDSALDAQISRIVVSDTDLYMLNAVKGNIIHAAVSGRGQLDGSFDCQPGAYGNITVGSMVDMLTLPKVNTLNSSVLGVDAAGNLLYCAPGQVSRPMSLTPPSTNWGRVTAIALDNGRLYVLDAPSRAVWVYANDKEGVFTDAPLFFFGNQIPEIQDAIDIAVNSEGLFILHADGHLTFCTNIEGVPTRCDSPVQMVNRFEAYGNTDVFAQAHFTQVTLMGAPDSTLLLLDADGRSVYRLGSRGFELQGILGVAGATIPNGSLGAIASASNHTLYLANGGQVYFTTEAP